MPENSSAPTTPATPATPRSNTDIFTSKPLTFDTFDAAKIVGDRIDLDDILLFDKPAGLSSFGVVARVRRALTDVVTKNYNAAHPENPVKRKKLKVGHAGTLDPFATGLLVLLVGKATKRSGDFLKLDKVYEAEAILGTVSTTGDPEGELTDFFTNQPIVADQSIAPDQPATANQTSTPNKIPTLAEIQSTAASLTGEISQKVPAFSAVKINGRRAYDLARRGQPVETPTRKVTIFSLEILEYNYPSLKYRAHVSSGTYIRTITEDLGSALSCGAYTKQLRRLKIGDLSL